MRLLHQNADPKRLEGLCEINDLFSLDVYGQGGHRHWGILEMNTHWWIAIHYRFAITTFMTYDDDLWNKTRNETTKRLSQIRMLHANATVWWKLAYDVAHICFVYYFSCRLNLFGYWKGRFTRQQKISDSKRTVNGRPMFGQQTDINLPTQPFVHENSGKPFAVHLLSNVWIFFFLVMIACILRKCYFLDFHWISFSFSFRYIGQPFVHKRTANGRPKYSSTVRAQKDSKLTSEIFVIRLTSVIFAV